MEKAAGSGGGWGQAGSSSAAAWMCNHSAAGATAGAASDRKRGKKSWNLWASALSSRVTWQQKAAMLTSAEFFAETALPSTLRFVSTSESIQDGNRFSRTTALLPGWLHSLTLHRPSSCITKVGWVWFRNTLSQPCNFGWPLLCLRKQECSWSTVGAFTWLPGKIRIPPDLFSLTEWKPRGILMPVTELENSREMEMHRN